MGFRRKSCYTNPTVVNIPDPDPSRWELLEKRQYSNAYVLKVRYKGCTNYEGIKILVCRGQYEHNDYLDPHFSIDGNIVARFVPNNYGMELADSIARVLI